MKKLDLKTGAEAIILQIAHTSKTWQAIRDSPESRPFLSYHKQAKCFYIKELILRYRKPGIDVEAAIKPFFEPGGHQALFRAPKPA